MKNKQNKLLGANLQAMRMKKDVKQETVAKELNVSKSYVSKIENGKMAITVTTLVNYCAVIGSDFRDAIGFLTEIV